EQREENRELEAKAEGEDGLHREAEIFADPCFRLDRQGGRLRRGRQIGGKVRKFTGNGGERLGIEARAATGLEAQQELPGERHDHAVSERTAEEKEDRRRNEEGQKGALLILVETGRDKNPELRGDDREGEENAGKKGDLEIGEEGFMQPGEDHPPPFHIIAIGRDKRLDEESEKLLRDEVAENKGDDERHNRIDKPIAEFDQMLHQRSLAVINLVITHGALLPDLAEAEVSVASASFAASLAVCTASDGAAGFASGAAGSVAVSPVSRISGLISSNMPCIDPVGSTASSTCFLILFSVSATFFLRSSSSASRARSLRPVWNSRAMARALRRYLVMVAMAR